MQSRMPLIQSVIMSRVFSIGYALLAEQVRQQGDDLHTNQGNTAPPQLMLVLLEIGTSKRAVSVRQSQEESINGRLSDRIGKSRCTSFFRRASALLVIPYRP